MNSAVGSDRSKRIRTLALLLLAAVLFSFSACGTPEEPVKTRQQNQVTRSEETQAQAGPDSSVPTGRSEGTETSVRETSAPEGEHSSDEETKEETAMPKLKMKIDGQIIPVNWENNESVDALLSLVSDSPLTIQMSMYGGFEQVGPLGTSLPRKDEQTQTNPGDIVLYSGSQIVVFYKSNSWAYTRLGKIEGLNGSELTELLGNGAVTLTLFAG